VSDFSEGGLLLMVDDVGAIVIILWTPGDALASDRESTIRTISLLGIERQLAVQLVVSGFSRVLSSITDENVLYLI